MKRILFIAFLSVWSFITYGQNVPVRIAKTVAKDKYTQYYTSKFKTSPAHITFSDEYVITEDSDTLYYIFNISNNRGFVIISADKRAYPVIGFSFNGNYSSFQQPPAFSEWMNEKKQEILSIKTSHVSPDSRVQKAWENFKSTNNRKDNSIGPLVETTWSQGCYYNSACPTDADGHCGHVLTGCVATAMAQVMKYWSYPKQGQGTHTDKYIDYGDLKVNFGATTYHWSDMPDYLNNENNAVATLMYHCGVSIDMDYGTKSSGSHTSYTVNALTSYFKYASTARFLEKESYSDTQWDSLVKNELDSLRPLLYRGHKASGGGHSFVCDGYDGDYFHFNWGWNGKDDGYFFLTNLSPTSSRDYSYKQGAVMGLHPLKPMNAGTLSGDTVVCQGRDSVLYTLPEISYATSYHWTLPNGKTVETSSDSIFVNYNTSSVSGSIEVYGQNKYSSGSPASLEIRVRKKPATPVISLLNGNILHSNTSEGNQWFNQNGIITDSTRQNFIVKGKGKYYVIVTQNGCRSDSSNNILIVNVGIQSYKSDTKIKFFPNPVKGQLTIEYSENKSSVSTIFIRSINGNILLQKSFPKGSSKVILDLKPLPKGTYIIELKNKNEAFTKKLIKL